jgi:hypothetical protein
MANVDAIIKELQQERDHIHAAINALISLSGNTLRARKGRMSAAARRRIAAGQRARWAMQKGTAQNKSGRTRPKHHISAAGLARIRAAGRARWARVKAAKK